MRCFWAHRALFAVKRPASDTPNTDKPKSIWRRISTVFFILLFTGIVVCICSVITTKYIYHQPAALFGYRIVKIITDSMTPDIPVNSYILVKNVNGADVREGDIVVHIPAYGPYAGLPMTHKCVRGPQMETEGVAAGQTCILTQGTKEGAPIDAPVPIANVQSVYVRSIARAGSFFDFLTSIWGIVVLIAVPSLVVIILQIVRMVKAVFAKPDEDAVKAEAERIEEERKKEALADMMGKSTAKSGSSVGEMGDVMAFIAREKSKAAGASPGADEGGPKDASAPFTGSAERAEPTDEMSSVMAFIAREKAKQKKDE